MKCEHYGKSDDCTIKCPNNTDCHCDIIGPDYYGGYIKGGSTRAEKNLHEQQRDAALTEIKAFCAVKFEEDFKEPYLNGKANGRNHALEEIELILKRYGL